MKITPLNLVFAVLLGFFAVDVLNLSNSQGNVINWKFEIWQFGILLCIVVIDIAIRATVTNVRKLWLIESLLIVVIAGLFKLLS